MRVNVVSDVHGSADRLARAGDGADALVCLGDLVLFIDYQDHSRGIFAELFGAANTSEFVRLRTAGRFREASE
ncbi:MAG TPA: metallophosphoesterase, partial [Candidatus Nanopelagicales bacterium]|nr:metallophosphoesterase [Candidatus Nanopelagicales bacterium]